MYYCLLISDGYIVGTAAAEMPFEHNVTAEEAESVKNLFVQKPTAEEGFEYKLRADTLEWVLVELPPEPEPELTPEEALEILLGGDGT